MTDATAANQRPLPPPPPDWQYQVSYAPPPPPPKKDRRGAIALLVVLILLFSILFASPLGRNFLSELSGSKSYAETATFTLDREITVEVAGGDIDYIYDIPKPGNLNYGGMAVQSITNIDTQPNPTESMKNGVPWYEWTGSTNSEITIHISYEAKVNTKIWDIDSSNSGQLQDIPASLITEQTGDEWEVINSHGLPSGQYKIWPSNSLIRDLAGQLTSDDATVYENVKSIYDYIRENIEYQTLQGSEPKSCTETLSDGLGDCDDQSILLISLCRAAGIPSWLAFGTLYDKVRTIWGAHAWAEVYVPLDDGTGEGVAIDVVNDEFMVRNCNRLEEWKSDGDGLHLADYYHVLSYNYSLVNPHQSAPVVNLYETYTGDYLSTGVLISGEIQAIVIFREHY